MELILEGTVNERYLRIALDKEYCRIGRSQEADIRLDEGTVSRFHAAVRVEDDHIILEDLGSHNGTFLNGTRINAPATVRQRDRIKIGSIELTLLPVAAPAVGIHRLAAILLPDDAVRILRQVPLEELPDPREATLGGENIPTMNQSRVLDFLDAAQSRAVTYNGHLQVITNALPQMILPQVLDEAVQSLPDLIGSVFTPRTLMLLLRDAKDQEIYLKAAWPSKALQLRKALLTPAILDEVMRERTARLLIAEKTKRKGPDDPVDAPDRLAYVAPLRVQGRAIGLVYAGRSDVKEEEIKPALEAFNSTAGLFALKLVQCMEFERRLKEFAQLEREKDRMADAIAIAARIQRKLLPAALPEIPQYELSAELWPSLETSGDLYDVTMLSSSSVGLVVGDVSGKGVGASLLMANVLASLRMSLTETAPLREIVERLNTQLERSTEPDHFVTLFLARLDLASHRLEYVNAGHVPPVLLEPGAEPRRLSSTGIPTGMMPDWTYTSQTIDFPSGSLLCVYTDGIPEAEASGEWYGEDRLLRVLLQGLEQPIRDIGRALLDDVEQFLQGSPLTDDTTLLLIRRTS